MHGSPLDATILPVSGDLRQSDDLWLAYCGYLGKIDGFFAWTGAPLTFEEYCAALHNIDDQAVAA